MPKPSPELSEEWTPAIVLAYLSAIIENNKQQSDQRFDDSKEAVTTALLAQKELTSAALVAAKEAVVKAEVATEKRLEGMNEFRGQLIDQATMLMPRSEAEQRMTQLAEKINDLDSKFSREFASVNKRLDLTEGHSGGMNAIWGYIIGGIGSAVAMISVIVLLIRV